MNIESHNKHSAEFIEAAWVFYIVGRRRLQNELISFYLEQSMGVRCQLYENIRSIPVDIKDLSEEEPGLILWDCQEDDAEKLLLELELHAKQMVSRFHLVLIHVPADFGFEDKFVWQGVRGFFYEQDPLDCIRKGIRAVIEGELWLSRKLVTKCILEGKEQADRNKHKTLSLTPREVEIVALVATWATNEEIAENLCISPHTVKSHLYNIFQKIGVPNRRQAALWATKNLDHIVPKY